ncbi:MAG: hypothetical protein LUG93_09800 [Lachnospiraceae bacterium]|nr:hypothetical protein [Lachnospiraceae bacterium]
MSGLVCFTAGPLPGNLKSPWRQVTAAANAVAARGGVPLAVSLQGLIPMTYEEPKLREDMKNFAAEAQANVVRDHGLQILDVQIQVSDQVLFPQYFVTCVGVAASKNGASQIWEKDSDECAKEPHEPGRLTAEESRLLRPGQELILTRQIALAGTAALANSHEKELLGYFPPWLVERAKGLDQWMSVTDAVGIIRKSGVCPMYRLSQGGIFNALWEMAEMAGVGLEVNLREIPIRQETVEICEYFDINPYYLYSEGALLIGTNQAEQLIHALQDARIPAAVIGRATDKNSRVIHNGENDRYLDRPKQDELWRFACP